MSKTDWFFAWIPKCFGIHLHTPEALELMKQWQSTPNAEDGTISAVFADWLEEHFEEVCSWNNRSKDVRLVIEELKYRAAENNGGSNGHSPDPPQLVDTLE